MSAPSRDLRSIASLLQTGVFGVSVALASAAAHATPSKGLVPESKTPDGANASVAARLQAIRDAVTEVSVIAPAGHPAANEDGNVKLAWWGNWNPWGNWHPWGNGWRNGGWGNGGWGNGWHNGGWGNGWHNGGWGNWHNW